MAKGRVAIIAITAVLALGIFSACGSSSSSESSSEDTNDEATEETTEEADTTSEEDSAVDSTADEQGSSFKDVLSQMGDFEKTTLKGTGDDVVDLPCPETPCLMDVTYEGEHNFIVHTLDSSGDRVEGLVNEIGSYSGTVTDYEKYKNACTLEIKADGDWKIVVKPMSSMKKLENGKTYKGDDVRYIDTDNMSKLSIENSSEHNFIVHAIGMNSSSHLVNKIGDYSGTVSWTEGQSFFIVQDRDGKWSISW